MRRVVAVVTVALVAACAPTVDGPVEKQRAADRDDATRLTAQLRALPGVERAEVILTRPARDPLSTQPPSPPSASVVLVVDDKADRTRLQTSTRGLVRALVPTVEPTIVIEVGVHRPDLARVGPFTVAASSQAPLKAALAIALGVIVLLAAWLAWTHRWWARR